MPDTTEEQVTDEQLDTASEELDTVEQSQTVTEDEVEDITSDEFFASDKTEEEVDDEEEEVDWSNELNKVRTNFGRKQKQLEDKVDTLAESINSLVTVMKTRETAQTEDSMYGDLDEDEPIPLTMKGLVNAMRTIQNQDNQKMSQEQQKYEDNYMNTVEKLGSQYSDKAHQKIVERMFKDFNNKHSGNPAMDAKLNFLEAEATILRELGMQKQNPLDKNKGKKHKNLGGSNNVQQDDAQANLVELDKYARDFINATGMNEEEASKALQGDMPMYLRGKVKI